MEIEFAGAANPVWLFAHLVLCVIGRLVIFTPDVPGCTVPVQTAQPDLMAVDKGHIPA